MPADTSPHRSRLLVAPAPGVHAMALESGRRFDRHWHDTYGIGVLVQGAQRSRSGRGPVEAVAGDVITHNPGEVHDGHPLGEGARRWWMLQLAPEALASLLDRPDAAGLEFERPVMQDPRVRTALHGLFSRLEDRAGPGSDDDALDVESALVRVAALLARTGLARAARARTDDADLRRVRERLADAAGDETPSLEALARLAGLSRWQLLRRFEEAHGLSPHAWLQQCRLQRARALIRAGRPLAEVAAACGFADQSHMTRLFTRQLACTPGAWARNLVQDASPTGR